MSMFINCASTDTMYHQRTDIHNIYMNEVRRYNVLSHSEQRRLIYKAQCSSTEEERAAATEKLVASTQRFVVSVAKKMANNNNLMDLINEGNIGLLMAINKFDLSKNFHFITYAVWWIKKQMIEYLANTEKLVRPSNSIKLYAYVKKANSRFLLENERQPTLEELQKFLQDEYNFRVSNLKDLEGFQGISLNSEYAEDDSMVFEDSSIFSNATATNNVEDNNNKNDDKTIVACLLSELPRRDADILRSAFGINCDKKTCDNIAVDTKLSRERVRQIISKSLKRLKQNNKQ